MAITETAEVLDVAGAAALLGVSTGTVLREARCGRLPGRRIGRSWRFSRRRLLDWLAADVDDEPLSDDDLHAIAEGLAAAEGGEVLTLAEYDQLRAARA